MKRATRLLYLLAVLPALALPADAQVQVSEEHTSKATDSSPAGHEWTQHRFTLNNGLLRYILGYQAHWATDGLAVHLSPEGYLGMPGPTSANWYAGGFMNILLNGKSLGKERPAGLRLVERGERGMVEMLWDAPDAQLRVRFMLEPGCDYLACELAVQPKTDLQRLELALNCFPSYFTSWNKRDGWRQIVGPATTVEQGAEATPDPAQDYWLLYQDTVFDVATEKDSGGPCGLLVVPEQVATMKVRPTSYPVSTHLAAAPGVLRWRMAFWDFHSKTNAEALQRLRSGAQEVLEHLREADFADRRVAAFDAARERAELDAMIARSTEPERWRQSLVPVLDKIAAALEANQGGDLAAEHAASVAMGEYAEGLWDLKFDALLND